MARSGGSTPVDRWKWTMRKDPDPSIKRARDPAARKATMLAVAALLVGIGLPLGTAFVLVPQDSPAKTGTSLDATSPTCDPVLLIARSPGQVAAFHTSSDLTRGARADGIPLGEAHFMSPIGPGDSGITGATLVDFCGGFELPRDLVDPCEAQRLDNMDSDSAIGLTALFLIPVCSGGGGEEPAPDPCGDAGVRPMHGLDLAESTYFQTRTTAIFVQGSGCDEGPPGGGDEDWFDPCELTTLPFDGAIFQVFASPMYPEHSLTVVNFCEDSPCGDANALAISGTSDACERPGDDCKGDGHGSGITIDTGQDCGDHPSGCPIESAPLMATPETNRFMFTTSSTGLTQSASASPAYYVFPNPSQDLTDCIPCIKLTPRGPTTNPWDRDCDGVPDDKDNCPDRANPKQEDQDKDRKGDSCDYDRDGDGWGNGQDNCPDHKNADQRDSDRDGKGDECDDDDDGDGKPDKEDNCSRQANNSQEDLDQDGAGDACDSDDDNDGAKDTEDNCPRNSNPRQEDSDTDGTGDACEPPADDDKDGDPNAEDNCPNKPNPGQEDADGDGVGDACDTDRDQDGVNDDEDNCPGVHNSDQHNADNDQYGDACDEFTDTDGDGDADDRDNCPNTSNPNQEDLDRDGRGDACENDFDNDGVNDDGDNCPGVANSDQGDADRDGEGDQCDTDDDNDGVDEPGDNCPGQANGAGMNGGQSDADADGQGDACDDDIDGDGTPNGEDDCPRTNGDCGASNSDTDAWPNDQDNCDTTYNPDQTDTGGDPARGDACEDRDGDGTFDQWDPYPDDPDDDPNTP